MPAIDIVTREQLTTLGSGLIVLNFWADWAAPCAPLNALFDQLADKYAATATAAAVVKFVKIEAEKAEELTELFEVGAVPTIVFVRDQKALDKVEGANGPDLANKLAKYAPDAAGDSTSSVRARCERLVNSAPVMLFMKGTADAPQCGFSRKMVDLLRGQQLQFDSFNILSDDQIRQGLKVGRWYFSALPSFFAFAQTSISLSLRNTQIGLHILNCMSMANSLEVWMSRRHSLTRTSFGTRYRSSTRALQLRRHQCRQHSNNNNNRNPQRPRSSCLNV
jgi:glutaredoxin-related protein